MAISQTELTLILQKKFPKSVIKIVDLVGDQDHYSLDITCDSFKDLSLIKQHQVVNNALSDVLKKDLHAITIRTHVR